MAVLAYFKSQVYFSQIPQTLKNSKYVKQHPNSIQSLLLLFMSPVHNQQKNHMTNCSRSRTFRILARLPVVCYSLLLCKKRANYFPANRQLLRWRNVLPLFYLYRSSCVWQLLTTRTLFTISTHKAFVVVSPLFAVLLFRFCDRSAIDSCFLVSGCTLSALSVAVWVSMCQVVSRKTLANF